MRKLLRLILPTSLRFRIHHLLGWLAAMSFGFPARTMTVIAVTGTNGKSTVVSMIGQLLRGAGKRVGWISTATVRIGDTETLNATKMTTPGPMVLHGLLRRMVRAGCTHVVLEASSEGLRMGRMNGIDPEIAVFTNLTPEHLESHGSFESYAKAKERLFQRLAAIRRQGRATGIVANIDDEHASRYLAHPADVKIGCTLAAQPEPKFLPFGVRPLIAEKIVDDVDGSSFSVEGVEIHSPFIGRFNVMNLLEAIAVMRELGVDLATIVRLSPSLKSVPGRMEFLRDLNVPYRVLVDYAPEPASMAALYSVLPRFGTKRIIHVFGSAGGGRDRARRPILGKFVTEHADHAIITNEDPYDEDPKRIIDDILVGTEQASPHRAKVEAIPDRRTALARAIELASDGDLVVVTGKACEQWIMGPHGSKTPWDDRRVVRELVGSAQSDS
ncbi:MAG: UDP-N-acetylmuramoyl-L-alanyl-D-glutamate--2,6-diaminopimelate ligase [Candidatus Kerfeldbacteria bacterium]|nr:UDP-N-acetylmuramoyl-L-alanyl-D-glutamate--2,6-diaminopimelate ligase [Candidatus Kerfeldbacteria bacterium]